MSVPISRPLAELIDSPALQSLMEDFFEIASIPMAIIDLKGRVLVGAGWQDICTKFHRVNPQTCKACIESDTQLSAGVPPGQFRRYKCKNNMWDLATPIMVRDRHVGNLFSGQFFFKDEAVDYERFREQARQYRFDEQAYLSALDRVPRLSRDAVDRGLGFFVKLAQMLSRLGDANVTLAQTIAERDRLTQSLSESEADLARAQAVAHTGSWRLDVRRNALTWSDEVYRMFGIPEGTALTYEAFLERVHPQDRATVDAAWRAALTGQPYDVEHRIFAGDQVKWVRETAELEFDDGGALRGGFGTVQDITKAKQLEAELTDHVGKLAEGNRLKDEFLSTLSHELRTPLNAILGWAQLLRTHGTAYPHADRAIAAIARNAEAQARLVEDVLDVSRIITGKLHLRQRTVDLAVLMERALDTVRPGAEAKEIRITTSVAEHALVVGDPDRLQQVMWNLLSNAVKFNNKGGRIDVAIRPVNSHIEVVVADTGIGIAAEFLPRLFERFSQHDSSTTRAYGGLGLGLAIVRHLVEMHGGTVHAESAGDGLGSVFTVRLPVRAVAPTGVSELESPQSVAPSLLSTPPSLQGLRVLVVDDDPSARELLQTVLTDFGATAILAQSAAEGFALLQSTRPDAVISDIGMPDVDGYTFMRKVRALPPEQGGAVPAIALTAYGHATDRYRALSAGYDQHVAKPVIPQELAVVVAVAVRKGSGV